MNTTGIATIPARHSVAETVEHLKQILEAAGIKVFAISDHSGEATSAGLHMPDTKLVIFGNPKAGTSLMLAVSTIALDLPLKILVWEDAQTKPWVTFNTADFLRERHSLPPALAQVQDLYRHKSNWRQTQDHRTFKTEMVFPVLGPGIKQPISFPTSSRPETKAPC